MTQRTIHAATAALLLLGVAAPSGLADIIILRDGKVLPKKLEGEVNPAEGPSDRALRRSGKNNADLAYDRVKVSGASTSASNVRDIYPTAAYENSFFRNGENQGQSGYWAEAADSFAEATEQLKGAAKQVAMYKRVLCLAETKDLDATFNAAQELLDAFPKAYYYAPIQIMRARILYSRGDRKKARDMIDSVVTASGMNARDYFEAKLTKIYLFDFKTAGRNAKKYAAARAQYSSLDREISARSGASQEAAIQRLKAAVGVGKCYVFEKSYAKARPYFERVIKDPESKGEGQLLAQAYTGLGDVMYATVKKELGGGKADASKLAEIQERLTDASLHYLRTAKFYVESAGDELYPATVGVARVWATQFTLGGETDCALAKRASKFFFEAHKMLPRGEVRSLLTREVKMFLDKRDGACKPPKPK